MALEPKTDGQFFAIKALRYLQLYYLIYSLNTKPVVWFLIKLNLCNKQAEQEK